MGPLPTGTVTFVFTDIEGSTRLVKALRERWGEVLGEHRALVREEFTRHGGHEVDTQGDAFFFAFSSAREAVAATVAAQQAIEMHEWPDGLPVRARMGVHTGRGTVDEDRYVGVAVHRAARICAAAHGGQIVVSQATRELLEDEEEAAEAGLRELGLYTLKDLDRPVQLYQVVAPGLTAEFPPLRAERGRARPRARLLLAGGLLVGAAAAAVLALTRDASAPVGVVPNTVAVIDPAGNEVVDAIPVGASPSAIVAGLGSVWVFNENDVTISRLDPVRRRVTDVVAGVTEPGRDAQARSVTLLAAGEGALWTGHADRLSRRGSGRPGFGSALQPPGAFEYWTGIATGLGRVWLVGPEPNVLELDPDRGTIARTVPLDAPDEIYGSSAAAVGLRAVWVTFEAVSALGRRSLVYRYDPVASTVARLPVEGRPVALAVGAGAVWVADVEGSRLLRIRPRPLAVARSTRVGRGPLAVAVGAGSVWTANSLDGTVSRVDPGTGDVTTIRIGHRPQGIVVANGLVWVSVRS